MSELADVLLRGPSPLKPGKREALLAIAGTVWADSAPGFADRFKSEPLDS